MLSPELVFLHHCIRFYLGIATKSEKTVRKWLKRVVSILRIAFHLQGFQKLRRFQQDKHVVFGQYLLTAGQLCELLGDVDALYVVDRRLDGDADVGFGDAKCGVGHDIEGPREAEIARVVRAKGHLDALVAINIGGVFDEVAIKCDGSVRGYGTQELRLDKTDVVFVDIHLGKDILEHRSQDIARVDELIHARRALSFDDALFLVLLLAVNLLRHCLIHRERKDEFTCFGRGFHVFLQERHSLKGAFFKDFWGDIAQCKGEFVVLLYTVVVALAEIASLFGGNHLFHQDDRRVVLTRILFALSLYHCCTKAHVDGAQLNDKRIRSRFGVQALGLIANT